MTTHYHNFFLSILNLCGSQDRKSIEKRKRYLFLGVESLGLLVTFGLTPILGVPVVAFGAYLGWQWFDYRAKNGMRF